MKFRRRLALVVIALPVAFYGYACSSDSTDGGGGVDAGGGTETGPSPGVDSSTETDSSTGTDSGTDASDGAVPPPTCIGNPLTSDGGTADGGVTLDAAVATQIVTSTGNFLDGPQWLDVDGGGFLVYSEFDQTERLLRVAADGGGLTTFRTANMDNANGPVGSAVRNGQLITAINAKTGAGAAGLIISSPDGGAAGTLSLGDAGSNSPNDLVVGPGNDIYFTDGQYQLGGAPGTRGLYRILGADGGVQVIQSGFGRANGIAITPDKATLYVGVGPLTGDAEPKEVRRYTVAATGVVTFMDTFLAAADLGDVPDGMAVDVGGNLWIAEAAAGTNTPGGRVEVFSPAKKKLGTIPFTTERPTGVAFGGADSKTLFITTETGVFTYVSRCAGVR